jgi:uncharacterized membrane protein (UPF0182 family)
VPIATHLLVVAATTVKSIYSNLLWIGSLGFVSVYTTQILTKIVLFFVGALLCLLLMSGTLWLTRRCAPRIVAVSPVPGIETSALWRIVSLSIAGTTLLLTLVLGLVAAGQWETTLRFLNATSFGTKDAAFGRDLSFYAVALPALRVLHKGLLATTIPTLLGVLGMYAFSSNLQGFDDSSKRAPAVHLGILLIGLLAVLCFGFVLSIFGFVVNNHGTVKGATYTCGTPSRSCGMRAPAT